MESNFIKATEIKLRFNICGSVISTEQLWDIGKRTSKNELITIDELIDYEAELEKLVESYGKPSRRIRKAVTQEQELNKLRLEIVSFILDTKQAREQAAQDAAAVKEHNQKILDLIKRKQDQSLESMSVEELEKLMK